MMTSLGTGSVLMSTNDVIGLTTGSVRPPVDEASYQILQSTRNWDIQYNTTNYSLINTTNTDNEAKPYLHFYESAQFTT